MNMIGSDPDALDVLAVDFEGGAQQLETLRISVRGDVYAAAWEGPSVATFRAAWDGTHGRRIDAAIMALRESADDLRRNAAEQREASGVQAGGAGTPAGRRSDAVPQSDRLAPAEAGHEVIEKQARYLRNAKGFREGLPNVHRVAVAWLEELQNGDPSPEEVAAFEAYMATAKVAFVNQSVVADAAEHAYQQFLEAGKAGGAVVGGVAQFPDEDPASFATRALREITGLGTDALAGAGTGQAGEWLGGAAAEAYRRSYLADSDAALVALESEFRSMKGVGYSDPLDVAHAQAEVYRSQGAVAAQKADFADAFSPFAGEGSVVDGALRSGLKLAGGPLTAKVLSGLEIAGSGAQATYHLQSAVASLSVVGNGVPNVYATAESLGVGRRS